MYCSRLLFVAIFGTCFIYMSFVVAEDDIDRQETETAAKHIPTFITEPKNLFLEEGATATLECAAERLEPFVMMWNKEDSPMFLGNMKISKDDRIEMDPNDPSRITIKDVTLADEGNYVCEIATSQEHPLRLTHVLRIKKEPHIKPQPPAGDVTVSEGDDVSLICQADGHPSPKVTWKTEGDVEFEVKKGNILNGGDTLVFKGVVETDAGQYECIASNGVGNEARVVYRLRVSHVPKITIEERLISTAGAASLELTCKVKADPAAKEVSWLRGSQPIKTGDHDHIHVHASGHTLRLKFTQLKESDFGNFTCVATNEMGITRESVHVSGMPHQVKVKSRPQGSEPNSYILEFSTQSVERIIDFQLLIREAATDDKVTPRPWREVIIPGKEDKSSLRYSDRYEISGLETATVYEIVLKARNSVGWSDPSEVFKFATLGGDLSSTVTVTMTTEKSTDKSSEMKSGLTNNDAPAAGKSSIVSFSKTSAVIVTSALLLVLF